MTKRANMQVLMVDTIGINVPAVRAGIRWLIAIGGGCIVAPNQRAMDAILDATTENQFKQIEKALAARGITLAYKRRGLPYSAENILAVYMDLDIDNIVQRGNAEHILLIPWAESEADWFKNAYRPTVVEVGKDETIVPAEHQPEWESAKGLLPKDQDRILEFLATAASGYDNVLQWREIERFKAELMNYRTAWTQLDPKLVLRRCTELGMSATDSAKVSDMVRRLREGHSFRPRRDFEKGWIH